MAQTISFSSDYTKSAHPNILKRLLDMGMEQNVGYGTDDICKSAAEKIKKACECPGAEVFFLVGGTLLTRGTLRPGQGPQPGAPIVLSGQPTSYDPSRPDAPEGQKEGQNPEQGSGVVLFLEDMWLFLKASLPYLGSAAAGAAITAFVLRKKEK